MFNVTLVLSWGELAIVDKGSDLGVQGNNAFVGTLAHIHEKLVSEVPEVVFRLDGQCNGVQYLPGCLLQL